MGSFKKIENSWRNEKFIKNKQDEDFLEALNQTLSDSSLNSDEYIYNDFPFIFLVGLPRSGTTLATQLIAQGIDIGYINNLIARFWEAPIQGIKLSNIVLKEDVRLAFESNYGKTTDIHNIHEFSYFWIKWLKMENIPPYDPDKAAELIDWEGLKKILFNMADAFGKGIVFKALNPGFHIHKISRLLDNSFFVYLERDIQDIAISLYKARLEYYGDPNVWCSLYPREYEQLKDWSYDKQIAGQVYFLRRQYLEQFRHVPESRKMVIAYQDLCAQPSNFIDTLVSKVNAVSDRPVERNNYVPETFEMSTQDKKSKAYASILRHLNNLF